VPSNELSALSKKAFNNWISKNPDKINPGMSLMDTLSDQLSLLKSGRESELLPVVKQTIDGGGTWESIFKYNLERNGYKDELLDELLERFRNDVRFKNADEWSKISRGEDVGEIADDMYQESLDELSKDPNWLLQYPAGLSINATSGVISGTLTATQTGSITYTVTATNTGGSTTATVTLVFNTAPTNIGLTPATVAENSDSGTTIGALSKTDADSGDTHTYTLVSGSGSTDNTSFTIAGGSLKTAAVFDFETKTQR
jgi:hypothetical protein